MSSKASKYQSFKTLLRQEFSYACVYCNIREPELGGAQSFGIDHYKPKSKFPHLELEYSNLLYACRNCNQYKSNYWHNFVQELIGQAVLNPRENIISEHLDKTEHSWKGKTMQGF
jgi:uncharacterized protein (TIGR02646 family)